jgi:outer membrane biosynthesis protein TonB
MVPGNLTVMPYLETSSFGQPICSWIDASRRFSLYLQPDVIRSLTMECRVAFKVSVGESGAVSQAEVVAYGDPPNLTLANASLAAARHWIFEPAHIEGLPVSGEVILHFRFSPCARCTSARAAK